MRIDLENTVRVSIDKLMSDSFEVENIEECQAEVHGNFVMVSYTKNEKQYIISLRKSDLYELKIWCSNGFKTEESLVRISFILELSNHLQKHNFARLFLQENIN